MKTKTDNTLPALTLPRLSEKLAELASDLARFALDFGIADNPDFPPRLATIGFTNGIILGLRNADAARQLEALLTDDQVPAAAEIKDAGVAFAAAFRGEPNWTAEVYNFLVQRWQESADGRTEWDTGLKLRLRILHGVHTGLAVAREHLEIAGKIEELTRSLWNENQFLSHRLLVWSTHDWQPFAPPFVEYTFGHYGQGTVERQVIVDAVARAYSTARNLNHPWDFSFWVQVGWNSGRSFARHHPKDAQALLEEASAETLRGCHNLYLRYVLGTAQDDGTVQIEQACLRYFGEFHDPTYARCRCTGHEPRRLARAAYDFAFWMGLLAAFPLPAETH